MLDSGDHSGDNWEPGEKAGAYDASTSEDSDSNHCGSIKSGESNLLSFQSKC